MKIQTPYFTIQYLLREFAKGFGTKFLAAKEIDDACKDNEITPQQLAKLKLALIHEPLTKYVNISFADHVMEQVDKVFDHYLEIMSLIPLYGVNAEKAQSVINKYFMSFSVANICSDALDGMRTTPQAVALSGRTMLGLTFDNLRRSSEWCEYENSCTKEQKDRFRIWSLGKDGELPDITGIAALGEQWRPGNGWGASKARLITARFWDYFIYRYDGCDLDLIRLLHSSSFDTFAKQSLIGLLVKEENKYQSLTLFASELYNLLRLRKPKLDQDKVRCRELLRLLKIEQDKLDTKNETTYYYYWMLARFNLHQGNLGDALDCYKLAFERVMYRQGENTNCIIREALFVACRLPKPDKVFINRLRRMAVIFKIDIQTQGSGKPENKKTCEDIEPWEISVFAKYFSSYFTKDSFFPGAIYPPLVQPNYGLWIVDESEYKLDLRRPDKHFKVGMKGGLVKKMPQVVYFAMKNDINAVKQLVKAGADINKLSQSGESALLLAIQEMDVTACPLNSMSQDLFDFIASLPHKTESLDTATLKRKLTVLACAVKTGRLDVVKKVIALGANVEKRYGNSYLTPLFICIGSIVHLTRPSMLNQLIDEMPYSGQNLQSIRAYSAGLLPHDLEHLKKCLIKNEDDPLFRSTDKMTKEHLQYNIEKYTTANEFREIALFLIAQGANPNAKHNIALNDFTPLMLAAELNEADLFKAMRSAGGDMQSTYLEPDSRRRVGLREIVFNWRSKDIVPLLS